MPETISAANRIKLHTDVVIFASVFLIVFLSVFLSVFVLIPLYYGHVPSLIRGQIESGVALLFVVVLLFFSCAIAGISTVLYEAYKAMKRRRQRMN